MRFREWIETQPLDETLFDRFFGTGQRLVPKQATVASPPVQMPQIPNTPFIQDFKLKKFFGFTPEIYRMAQEQPAEFERRFGRGVFRPWDNLRKVIDDPTDVDEKIQRLQREKDYQHNSLWAAR